MTEPSNARRTALYSLLPTLAALLLCALPSFGQQEQRHDWEQYYELLEDIGEEQDQDVYDQLYALEASPININSATKEDLEAIPFLSPMDITAILDYRNSHNKLLSAGDLAMVGSLTWAKRQLLGSFLTFEKPKERQKLSLKNALKYGEHEFTASIQEPLYKRQGEETSYLGNRLKNDIRYEFRYRDQIKIGLIGAKDSGEPFFNHRNKWGYDFYSYYLQIGNIGKLKRLVLGRYKVSFGLGLVASTGFSLGKVAALSSLGRRRIGISGHASRSEANYLQGIAATIEPVKGLEVSGFASVRTIDGNVNETTGDLLSITQTGLHRTFLEQSKKDIATEQDYGANVRYFKNGFHIGMTAVYTSVNRRLSPNKENVLYRKYYMEGSSWSNYGINYGWAHPRFIFSGETALSQSGSLATINSLTFKALDELSLVAVQRYYMKDYTAMHATSFSEGGKVQNESGIYLGATWRPVRSLVLTAYSDYAHFPFARYQAFKPSDAWDNMLSATWTTGHWSLFARYRYKTRGIDNEDKTALYTRKEHRTRLYGQFRNDVWHIRAQSDVSYICLYDKETGYMLSLQGGAKVLKKLDFSALAGYFHTPSYLSRVYLYEPNLRYDMYTPSYSGKGMRLSLFMKGQITRSLLVRAKIGTTKYFDRNVIGTGLQQIRSSVKTDLYLQVAYTIGYNYDKRRPIKTKKASQMKTSRRQAIEQMEKDGQASESGTSSQESQKTDKQSGKKE